MQPTGRSGRSAMPLIGLWAWCRAEQGGSGSFGWVMYPRGAGTGFARTQAEP
jgi:hypothetical protein